MDKNQAALSIITHALPLVPFDGWSKHTLEQAAITAGYQATDVVRVFPNGVLDAIEIFLTRGDAMMVDTLKTYSLDTMKIRERIATAVRIRLTADAPYREAVRKLVAIHAMPFNAPHALRSLYQTVDAIWHAVGDTSTDFNFYTKRLMLAGVYTSTLVYWLNDQSPDHEKTWEFLNRRIDNVMAIEKGKHKLKSFWKSKKP